MAGGGRGHQRHGIGRHQHSRSRDARRILLACLAQQASEDRQRQVALCGGEIAPRRADIGFEPRDPFGKGVQRVGVVDQLAQLLWVFQIALG